MLGYMLIFNITQLTWTQLSRNILLVHYFWKFWACLDIPDHTQLNQHNDQIAACMDVKLPENNQCNNLKLSGNICNYLFQRTFPWPHPTKIILSNYSFHEYLQNQCSNSTLSEDIDNLLFPNTMGMPGHTWPHPAKIVPFNCAFHECLTTCKKSIQYRKTQNISHPPPRI